MSFVIRAHMHISDSSRRADTLRSHGARIKTHCTVSPSSEHFDDLFCSIITHTCVLCVIAHTRHFSSASSSQEGVPISCELRLGAFSARGAAPAAASGVEVTESRGDQCKVEVLFKVEQSMEEKASVESGESRLQGRPLAP